MRELILGWILVRPKPTLILSTLLFLAFIPGLFFLKVDFSYRAWYTDTDTLLLNYDKFERIFGNDDSVVISIKNKNGLYNPQAISLIYKVTEELWKVPGIVKVDSLTNFDFLHVQGDEIEIAPLVSEFNSENLTIEFIKDLKEKIRGHKLIGNYLISKDSQMALVRTRIRPSLASRQENDEVINTINKIIDRYRFEYPSYEFDIAGTAMFIHIFKEITQSDFSVIIPSLIFVFILIQYIIFRNAFAVLTGSMTIIVSVIMMLGFAGYFGFYITTLSASTPVILLTIAIADAIHLLTVYFFAIKQGHTKIEAAEYSLRKNFYPTVLTSLTTAIGFLSFSNSLIRSIAELGMSVGVGVIFAWIVCYFILGPILVLTSGGSVARLHKSIVVEEKKFIISNRTKDFVTAILNLKYPIAFTSLLIVIISLVYAMRLEVNLDPNTQFKADHHYNIAFNKMTKHIGPVAQIEMIFDAGSEQAAQTPEFLSKIEEFESWLVGRKRIINTYTINDVIKDINQTLNQNNPKFFRIPRTNTAIAQNLFFYSIGLPVGRELNDKLSIDGRYLRLSATWDALTSTEANNQIKAIQEKTKSMGLDGTVTGKMPLFHQLTPYVVSSFIESFIIALTAITIILIIVLKSFKLGLLALIPNLFPIIISCGLYAYSGSYVEIVSVLIVAVCLGIAVDDSIHFMFEYKKFRSREITQEECFRLIFTNTAPSLFNTTVLIVIGFTSMLVADYLPTAKFGFMIGLTLSFALLADFIVLPAILALADRRHFKNP